MIVLDPAGFDGVFPPADPGFLIPIDKPAGWTSFRVVGAVRKLTGVKKVGHGGTLDPMATGLLLLAVGKATKQLEGLLTGDKEYLATVVFGHSTPSYDAETEPDAEGPVAHLTAETIRTMLESRFTGEIRQRPPIYSALKQNGVPLYRKARKGESADIPERDVLIREAELLDWNPPVARIRVACGKGTYIRSLAHDLGIALDTRAHLGGLVRTGSGVFRLEQAFFLPELVRKADPNGKTGLPR